ncbi:hypothetical protein [Gryllotalpicola sp.]|uniref:hypothetical protein n=1 Tax=Gryllotalpicola sp. TaxID=1932787 RepID=UPI0026134C7F|nr:hypothetical protein [Gryllotalpicola sp.]
MWLHSPEGYEAAIRKAVTRYADLVAVEEGDDELIDIHRRLTVLVRSTISPDLAHLADEEVGVALNAISEAVPEYVRLGTDEARNALIEGIIESLVNRTGLHTGEEG